ncbi:MAG: sce7726 family protein [Solobacterium sp.]|nr:sce7726 family protein [Solobacterium sp.]
MSLLDRDIREPLFEWLEANHSMVRILEEKQIGRSRADVVAVTEQGLIGMEIKSDADTYARLSRQVKDYDRYYDFNVIVAGTSHAGHVAEHVPEWWGIVTVEMDRGQMDFYEMRNAKPNPKMKIEKQLSLLWRPELALIQERNGLPKYREKSKEFVQKKLLEKLPADLLHEEIVHALFERDYTLIEAEIDAFRAGRR